MNRACKMSVVTHALPAGVGILALLVYLLTLAPDLTWANHSADGGELITAAVTLGVPHPPGYPTYVLLGHLWSYLPFEPAAYRFNLFSAVTMAAAAALAAAAAAHLPGDFTASRRKITAATAGLLFAFAPLVWGQAVVTEVYSLNLLAVALLLWALLSGRPAWLAGLFLGLSLTAHLTSALLVPLALGLVDRARWTRLAAGFLAGLTPLLALPWLAQSGSPVIWGEPATLSGWQWLVTARLYYPNLFAPDLAEYLYRLDSWSRALAGQFTWLGLPLLAWGMGRAWRQQQRRAPGLLLLTVLLYALHAFINGSQDAALFFLPAIPLLSLLLVYGLAPLGWAALILPIVLVGVNFSQQNLRQDATVRPLVEAVWPAAPQDAILLTSGDHTTFALWYFHFVEGERPDLAIIDVDLYGFAWYRAQLGRRYPELVGLETSDPARFREQNQQYRPICKVNITIHPVKVNCSTIPPDS